MALLETLGGGLLGGLLRLAPEILKWMDRKGDRAHELEMTRLSIDSDRLRAEARLALQTQAAEATFQASSLQALIESVKAQATPSGVRWIDGLSSLVRPSITYAFFGLYALCRLATFSIGVNNGIPVLDLLHNTWTPEDQVILSGIINFWFLGRVFDKALR